MASSTSTPAHNVSRIHKRYRSFQKEQRDIWESYCIVDFYVPKIKNLVRTDELPTLEIDRIWNDSNRSLDKNNTYGALSSLVTKGNFRRTLLEIVLIFEDYMAYLISSVYTNYPKKLQSEQAGENEAETKAGFQKLIRLILDSDDKDEMISRLVEEKVRGIFYGNPVDVFLKDKARLEFGTYFKDSHSTEVNKFRKIVATRNLLTSQ